MDNQYYFYQENVPKPRNKHTVLHLFLIVDAIIIIVALACYIIFGGGLSDNAIPEILQNNGYSVESYMLENTIDLPGGIDGLPSGDKNKLILVNNNGNYTYVVVNTEHKSVTGPVYGFIPLNVVQTQIWSMDKETNIKCLNIFEQYVSQYGINCMEIKTHAESYLRELTQNGVISLDTARNLVSNSTMDIFPSIKSNDEVVIIFERNSAVPAYYTTPSSKLVYNWNSMWSESQYNDFVRTSLTKTELAAISRIYGPPYSQKTVWAVVDSNLNEVGIYNSLDEVKNIYQK